MGVGGVVEKASSRPHRLWLVKQLGWALILRVFALGLCCKLEFSHL